MESRCSSSPVCAMGSRSPEIVQRDLLRAAGDLVHRRERAPDQEIAPAGCHHHHHRQGQGQKQNEPAQHFLDWFERRPDLHEKMPAIVRLAGNGGNEQRLLSGSVSSRREIRSRSGNAGTLAASKLMSFGLLETYSELPSARVMRMKRSLVSGANQELISLSTCASPVWPIFASSVSAICCAPPDLRPSEALLQIKFQHRVHQAAQQHEHHRQHAGVPGHQPKAYGARVHASGSSLML